MDNLKLWENYKKIVHNKKFFELKDIDKLELNYNMLFVLGKKNIGKSYQINELILNCKGYFVYGRFSRTEIETTRMSWNFDVNWPYFIDSKNIIRKKNEDGTIPRVNGEMVGLAVVFTNLQNTASAFNGFEGFTTIIFDEIIPLNPNDIKPKHVESFIKFVSNVERFKTNLKIYLFGNNNGPNALMSTLQLSILDNLVYREDDNRLLFINTMELFTGIEKQQATTGLLKYAIAFKESLLTNKPLSVSARMIKDLSIIKKFDYWISIVQGSEIYHIKRTEQQHQGYNIVLYLLYFEPFINQDLINKLPKVITFNYATVNEYDNVFLINSNSSLVNTILKIINAKRLFFENPIHVSMLLKILNKFNNV